MRRWQHGSWANRPVNADTTEENHCNTSATATLESVAVKLLWLLYKALFILESQRLFVIYSRPTAAEITFEMSLVVFIPNITTNHAITYTKTSYFTDLIFKRYSKLLKTV